MKRSIYIKSSKPHINEIITSVLVILASIAYLLGFKTIGFVVPLVYGFYYYMKVLQGNK